MSFDEERIWEILSKSLNMIQMLLFPENFTNITCNTVDAKAKIKAYWLVVSQGIYV